MGNRDQDLTIRQEQVLRALKEGFTVKQIAIQLNVSQRTVRGHLEILKQKFAARTLEQLIARTQLNRTLPPDDPSGGREEG